MAVRDTQVIQERLNTICTSSDEHLPCKLSVPRTVEDLERASGVWMVTTTCIPELLGTGGTCRDRDRVNHTDQATGIPREYLRE